MILPWKIVTSADYAVSRWSGGVTTQLAIWPPEAVYAERDFLWRVSSARVETATSDFTPLPDYDRLIAPLEGEMTLWHDGGAPVTLTPFAVHAFSGAWDTRSAGICTDFNLMLRRGRAVGSMEALFPTGPLALEAGPREETLALYCVRGRCVVSGGKACSRLRAGETLLARQSLPLLLEPEGGAPAALMLCRVRLCGTE
ncbi:MAG: HutD family protein [Clostridia bacterium]|nr:HutD family protein [Clostridia bacterium]